MKLKGFTHNNNIILYLQLRNSPHIVGAILNVQFMLL